METKKTKINSIPQQGVFNFTTLVSLYAFNEQSEHAFPTFYFYSLLCISRWMFASIRMEAKDSSLEKRKFYFLMQTNLALHNTVWDEVFLFRWRCWEGSDCMGLCGK